MALEFNVLAALAGFALASFFDLRERRVPDWLSFGLMAAGLVVNAFSGINALTQSVLVGTGSFLLAFALYRVGGWAGGDVKLFTALGFLVPSLGSLAFFPLWVFIASFVAVFPFVVLFVLWHLASRPMLRRVVKKEFQAAVFKSIKAAAFFVPVSLAFNYFGFLVSYSTIKI